MPTTIYTVRDGPSTPRSAAVPVTSPRTAEMLSREGLRVTAATGEGQDA